MATIVVDGVPPSIKRRGVFVRTVFGGNSAAAGAATARLLLIGNMITAAITAGSYTVAAGTATVAAPVLPSGIEDADARFGRGSELALMYRRALKAAPRGLEVWCAPSTNGTGTAAQTVTFATTATGTGVTTIEVGDETYVVPVYTGDTVTAVAARLVSAVNANPNSRVTATNSSGVVTLSAKITNQRGAQIRVWGQITPGIGTTVTLGGAALAVTGAVEDITSALTAVFPMKFDLIVVASDDATNIDRLRDHLVDAAGPTEQRRQMGVAASVDTQGNTTTLAQGSLNDPQSQVLWQYRSRWTTGEIAAAWGARRLLLEAADAASVLVGIEVPGLPPQRDVADQPSGSQISTCLDTGVTPLVPGDGGLVFVERSITTRSLASGLPNYGVLDTHKVRVPFFLADEVQRRLLADFPRMKIEADPTGDAAGTPPPQGVARPSMIAAAIDSYRRAYEGQLIPTGSVDAEPVEVQIDPSNEQRVLFELPIDVIEWLVSMAGNARQNG